MPAAGTGTGVVSVPAGQTEISPAAVAATAVLLVWGVVTACWAGGAAGLTEGTMPVAVPVTLLPSPSRLGH